MIRVTSKFLGEVFFNSELNILFYKHLTNQPGYWDSEKNNEINDDAGISGKTERILCNQIFGET